LRRRAAGPSAPRLAALGRRLFPTHARRHPPVPLPPLPLAHAAPRHPRTGLRALCRAFIPELLPDDIERRALLLPDFDGPTLGGIGPTHDVFGDGSALLVALPGHARGQLGLLAQTRLGPLFFVADSCWLSQSFRTNSPPHWITNAIVDDARALRATLARLHDFARDRPEVAIVPSHCPEAFARFAT
jgi:glyoxylase-like metal-dependent hydrolase (beta-lactamase superfamily II)